MVIREENKLICGDFEREFTGGLRIKVSGFASHSRRR
jgi:hypothetical protein